MTPLIAILSGIEGEASVLRVAQRLDYVQSSLTARVKQLEEELETPLFYRHKRGAAHTPAGATLLPHSMVGQPRYAGILALHTLPPATAVIPTVFVRRRDTVRTRAVEALLALIRSAPDPAQADHCNFLVC